MQEEIELNDYKKKPTFKRMETIREEKKFSIKKYIDKFLENYCNYCNSCNYYI